MPGLSKLPNPFTPTPTTEGKSKFVLDEERFIADLIFWFFVPSDQVSRYVDFDPVQIPRGETCYGEVLF